ncbi:MAG: sugar ABC transporter ATP-binding protein [Clostridiales bacterium]
MSDKILLKARQVLKQYPGTRALDCVDFNTYEGKVNVLIGENGAGKSTLMKICAGVEQATSGKFYINDQLVSLKNTKEAQAHGIGIIYQELNLFPELNVAQNIFMAKEEMKNGMLNNKYHHLEATKIMNKLEHAIDSNTLVKNLRVGQQQIVEIAKTMIQDNLKILIMDEPTSSLSNSEVEILFRLIDELKSQGISIIYISHRLEEIMKIGDYVTVLRDGKVIEEEKVQSIDVPWIVRKMVGKGTKQTYIDHDKIIGDIIFETHDLSLGKLGGGYLVDHVNLNVKAGEVLGLYGLMGAGRTELIESIMGLHPEVDGAISINGKKIIPRNNKQQIANGLGHIPEDRQGEGLIQTMSIEKNITLSILEKLYRWLRIDTKKEKDYVKNIVSKLYIKVGDHKNSIMSLSGGNQQKVVIGKWMLTKPKVLFMDEPTRGIDVGAKEDVFKIMNELSKEGIGIIFVGSDLKEVISVSDRIIVMSNGAVTGTFSNNEVTEQLLVDSSYAGH